MLSTLSTLNLPPELYRDITENLCNVSDRPTLVSLALVDTAWRQESQRVLFRTVYDGGYQIPRDPNHERKHRETHIQFLRAILNHPKCLGPYVRSYAQIDLAAIRVTVRNPLIAQHAQCDIGTDRMEKPAPRICPSGVNSGISPSKRSRSSLI